MANISNESVLLVPVTLHAVWCLALQELVQGNDAIVFLTSSCNYPQIDKKASKLFNTDCYFNALIILQQIMKIIFL